MPSEFKRREVRTPVLTVKLEMKFYESTFTIEEITERLQYLLSRSDLPQFGDLVVAIMRETRSSMWELEKLEVV